MEVIETMVKSKRGCREPPHILMPRVGSFCLWFIVYNQSQKDQTSTHSIMQLTLIVELFQSLMLHMPNFLKSRLRVMLRLHCPSFNLLNSHINHLISYALL